MDILMECYSMLISVSKRELGIEGWEHLTSEYTVHVFRSHIKITIAWKSNQDKPNTNLNKKCLPNDSKINRQDFCFRFVHICLAQRYISRLDRPSTKKKSTQKTHIHSQTLTHLHSQSRLWKLVAICIKSICDKATPNIKRKQKPTECTYFVISKTKCGWNDFRQNVIFLVNGANNSPCQHIINQIVWYLQHFYTFDSLIYFLFFSSSKCDLLSIKIPR